MENTDSDIYRVSSSNDVSFDRSGCTTRDSYFDAKCTNLEVDSTYPTNFYCGFNDEAEGVVFKAREECCVCGGGTEPAGESYC